MIYYFVCTASVYSVKTIFRVTILIIWNYCIYIHTLQKSNICIVLPQMMKNMQIELEKRKTYGILWYRVVRDSSVVRRHYILLLEPRFLCRRTTEESRTRYRDVPLSHIVFIQSNHRQSHLYLKCHFNSLSYVHILFRMVVIRGGSRIYG